jgi:hypothetical protein
LAGIQHQSAGVRSGTGRRVRGAADGAGVHAGRILGVGRLFAGDGLEAVGESNLDGRILREGRGELEVAAYVDGVQAVADRDQMGRVAGPDVFGVANRIEAGQQRQAANLNLGGEDVQLVESGHDFRAAHRPDRSLVQEFHAVDSRHTARQFSSRKALICQGF